MIVSENRKLTHYRESYDMEYYVEDETNFILDKDKKYVYCHIHYDNRIYMDENEFMQCAECLRVFGAKR
jgi:hypothetical protein